MATTRTGTAGLGLAGAVALAGCASLPDQAGFPDVAEAVDARIGHDVHWHRVQDAEAVAGERVSELLAEPLDAAAAVQVSLLKNPRLQADFEALGIAQANLVQAGLLKNPMFGAEALYEEGVGKPAWDFDLVFPFLDMLLIPSRKRIARAELEATKLDLTGRIIGQAAAARRALYAAQADAMLVGLFEETRDAAKASLTAAERLRGAGNVTRGDLAQRRLALSEAEVALKDARMAARASRERLALELGVPADGAWRVAPRLPLLPREPLDTGDLEGRVMDASLKLEALRRDVAAAAERLDIAEVQSVIPDLEVGAVAERERSGDWEFGPLIELQVPVFDQGQARRGRAAYELERARRSMVAQAAVLRSNTRVARDRMASARARVEQMVEEVLPLNREVTEATLLEYNAMQVGVFTLLSAYERQLATHQRFVAALRDYWLARADLETLLSGLDVEAGPVSGPVMANAGGDDGGH